MSDHADHEDDGPFHPQVLVNHAGFEALIDEDIAPLILACWQLGIDTDMSCQANLDRWVWIAFATPPDATAFLYYAALGDTDPTDLESIRNRIAGRLEPDDWEAYRTERRWQLTTDVFDLALEAEDDDLPPMYVDDGLPNLCMFVSVRFPLADLDEVTRRLTYVASRLVHR